MCLRDLEPLTAKTKWFWKGTSAPCEYRKIKVLKAFAGECFWKGSMRLRRANKPHCTRMPYEPRIHSLFSLPLSLKKVALRAQGEPFPIGYEVTTVH